jgi:hypothetical protein
LRRVQADFSFGGGADGDDLQALLGDRLRAEIISSAMFTALDIWLTRGAGDFENLERLIDSALEVIADGIR